MAKPEVQWLTVSPAHSTATQDRARVQLPAIVQSSIVQFSVHRDSVACPIALLARVFRYRSTPSTQQYSSSIVPCGRHSGLERSAAARSFCIAQKVIAPSPIKSPAWNYFDQFYATQTASLHRIERMTALQRTAPKTVLHREKKFALQRDDTMTACGSQTSGARWDTAST